MTKILKYHSNFNMQPFFGWDLKMLPMMIAWFERAAYLSTDFEAHIDERKLSSIYQLCVACQWWQLSPGYDESEGLYWPVKLLHNLSVKCQVTFPPGRSSLQHAKHFHLSKESAQVSTLTAHSLIWIIITVVCSDFVARTIAIKLDLSSLLLLYWFFVVKRSDQDGLGVTCLFQNGTGLD